MGDKTQKWLNAKFLFSILCTELRLSHRTYYLVYLDPACVLCGGILWNISHVVRASLCLHRMYQVGVEDITDVIEAFEDYVQSVDMTTSE